jgi:serine/threonine protein kinase/Tol biopolymer transport system component
MIGSTISHYRIVAEIGRGGMGVVYRAEDTKLTRQVALKFLPQHGLITDEQRARFAQEAQTAATLNHPNICTIHSIEEGEGGEFIVMEFVEGQTLREKVLHGGLKLTDALDYGIQIAEALQEAHTKGIVHRDIKSENIMITPAKRAKVMDFGLAKLRGAMKLTRTSSTIGTLAYMSPEQIQGEEVDARADLFSFGVVLYEMLTGRMPFRGEHEAAMVYSIVNEEAEPLTNYLVDAPTGLSAVIEKALEKDPAERYQSAADLAVDLKRLRRGSGRVSRIGKPPVVTSQGESSELPAGLLPEQAQSPSVPPGTPRRSLSVPLMGGLILAGVVLGTVLHRLLLSPSAEPVLRARFEQLTDLPGREASPDISPDGSFIAYAKPGAGGKSDIFWQRTGGGNPLNLTEGSDADKWAPSFSADGTQIAVRSERGGGGVFIMGATGESVRRLTDFGHNPAWSPDGKSIVVATEGIRGPLDRGTISQLWIVDVTTGESKKIFDGDAVQPDWSPGGARIAFWGLPYGTGQRDLWTIDASGGEPVRVTDDIQTDWCPKWSPDGRWLFFSSDRGGTMNLWRIPIDETSGRVEGEPQPVTAPAVQAGSFDLSGDGAHLVFESISIRSTIRAVRFDPQREAFVGTPVPVTQGSRFVVTPQVSPDGKWIVVRSGFSPEDLFLAAVDGSEMRRLTNDIHKDRGPAWTPDGGHVVFYSSRGGRYEIWWIRPDGSGLEQLTDTPSQSLVWAPLVHPDGKRLFFIADRGTTVTDFEPASAQKSYVALPRLPEKDLAFSHHSISPDGLWLAGHRKRADDTSVPGIVVYSIEKESYALLTDSGVDPVWLPDSRRLFFADEQGLGLVDRQTRRVKRLTVPGVDPGTLQSFTLAADGKSLFTSETAVESDLWQAIVQ